ncbi:unnamed protein product [Urochloa humidicola]
MLGSNLAAAAPSTRYPDALLPRPQSSTPADPRPGIVLHKSLHSSLLLLWWVDGILEQQVNSLAFINPVVMMSNIPFLDSIQHG